MATTSVSPLPVLRFVDSNGNSLTGGKLFTYAAGTTTKQNTYTDSTGNTANANPVVLNSRGEANVWLTQSQAYKFTLSPSTDTDPPTNPIWTVDNIQPGFGAIASGTILGNTSGSLAAPIGQTLGAGIAGSGGVLSIVPRGFLGGMILSNDVTLPNTVIDVSAGVATDSTNAVAISLGAFTKSTAGSWVAGTGNNGMGTGLTVAVSTWYHVFAIVNAAAADVYFDTSVTAANKPAGTTAFRRIGSILTDGSAHITAFIQNGDRFDWATPGNEMNFTPGVTTAVTRTLSSVPLGVVVEAILTGNVFDATGVNTVIYVSSLAQADVAASSSGGITGQTGGTSEAGAWYTRVMTNTSGQVRVRVSTTTVLVGGNVNGWVDTRGRFA